MFAKYIQINYGTATPKLLTFLCVTHNFSWLLSQKMWQPVTLKVGFLPYTKGQYVTATLEKLKVVVRFRRRGVHLPIQSTGNVHSYSASA